MVRYTLLTAGILFLCGYAWKDWYKALCGLIVMMAVIGYSGMPRGMFGIPGASPFNLVLANIMLAWFSAKGKEGLKWDVPKIPNRLAILCVIVVVIAVFRYSLNWTSGAEAYELAEREMPTPMGTFGDYFVNGLRWIIPGCLLFMGCRDKKRLEWAVVALVVLYLLLGILVIKWMPLGLLVDGDQLQARAIRVLDREIGYFRTNLSVMLAGGFWVTVAARNYFPKKYSLLLGGASSIVLLGMVLTGGRGGYMAWAAVGLIVAFTKYRRYLILAPLLIGLVFTFIPSVQDRVLGNSNKEIAAERFASAEEAELDAVSAGRTEAWPRVLGRVMERPFVGYGFHGVVTSGVTLELFQEYRYTFFHPHNAYLQQLIDNGILGALPFLILFFIIAKTAWSLFIDSRRPEYVLAGGVAIAMVYTFLFGGLTGQSFYPEERSVGMWCAIALMARVAIQRHKFDSQSTSAKRP